MKYAIHLRNGYLSAELHGRETSVEMREFLVAVKAKCKEHGCPRILLSIRSSRAMFKAEDYGLDGNMRGYVTELVTPSCRIAMVGDTSELNFAHEYIELVARQQQVNLRSFRDHASALRWLADEGPEKTLPLDALKPAGAPKTA